MSRFSLNIDSTISEEPSQLSTENTAEHTENKTNMSFSESTKEITSSGSVDVDSAVLSSSKSKLQIDQPDDDEATMGTVGTIDSSDDFVNNATANKQETETALDESKFFKVRSSVLKAFIRDREDEKLNLSKYFRVTSNTITILSSQEPWPKDVQLFQPYEVEQILLPDNANCLAVQTYLKMCQLEYKVEARANAEAMSPTGRVPFIKCGAFIVSELEGIVQFVGSKGISLTSELDAESKADMRAYMTLVNNVLGNAELYLCWCDTETYTDVTKNRYGSVYPWPLNHTQTWAKCQEEVRRLKVIGWYQKTLEEVYNDVETCCQALTDRLDGNQFFFGQKFTELDALLYGHLHSILSVPMGRPLAPIIRQFPPLVAFCQSVEMLLTGRLAPLPRMPLDTNATKKQIVSHVISLPPTELEALIFGHLYTILTTPLPNAALANIVKNYPKLIDLITRLERKYFQRETAIKS